MEIWKDIKGFKGYQASNYGNVRNLNYHSMIGIVKILKQEQMRNGYLRVTLSKDGKTCRFLSHRLIYEVFNGPIPEGMQINHLDENPKNNRIENLEVVTPSDNLCYGNHNKKVAKSLVNNEKICRKILQYDLEGNFIKEWPSFMEINRQTGFMIGNILKCCKGKYKQAYKYKWVYG